MPVWKRIDALIRSGDDTGALDALYSAGRDEWKRLFRKSFLAHRLLQLDSALFSGLASLPEDGLSALVEAAGLVPACHFKWQVCGSDAKSAQQLKYSLRRLFSGLRSSYVQHPYIWGPQDYTRLDAACFRSAKASGFLRSVMADDGESGPALLDPDVFGGSLFQGRLMSPDVYLALDAPAKNRMLALCGRFTGSSVFQSKFVMAMLDDPGVPAEDKAAAVREMCSAVKFDVAVGMHTPNADVKRMAEHTWLSQPYRRIPKETATALLPASSYGEFALRLASRGEDVHSGSVSDHNALLFMLMFRPEWAVEWREADPEGMAEVADVGKAAEILVGLDFWEAGAP